MSDVIHDDAYYIALGKAAAAEAAAVTPGTYTPAPAADTQTAPKTFSFGQMAPVGSAPAAPVAQSAPAAAPSGNLQEDALVARILAAMGQTPVAAPATPAAPLSKEDQRVVDVLARVYPSGRDVLIKQRYSVGTNLFVLEIAYTPSTGTRRDTEALVFDDGKKTFVFGAI